MAENASTFGTLYFWPHRNAPQDLTSQVYVVFCVLGHPFPDTTWGLHKLISMHSPKEEPIIRMWGFGWGPKVFCSLGKVYVLFPSNINNSWGWSVMPFGSNPCNRTLNPLVLVVESGLPKAALVFVSSGPKCLGLTLGCLCITDPGWLGDSRAPKTNIKPAFSSLDFLLPQVRAWYALVLKVPDITKMANYAEKRVRDTFHQEFCPGIFFPNSKKGQFMRTFVRGTSSWGQKFNVNRVFIVFPTVGTPVIHKNGRNPISVCRGDSWFQNVSCKPFLSHFEPKTLHNDQTGFGPNVTRGKASCVLLDQTTTADGEGEGFPFKASYRSTSRAWLYARTRWD